MPKGNNVYNLRFENRIQWRDIIIEENEYKPYDPAVPLLGINPMNLTYYCTETCLVVVTASLLTTIRKYNQFKYPSADEWIMKV